MPKNIVILADGTGQEGGVGFNTNVYKIFNIIEDRTDKQIVYYDPGLGTRGGGFTGLISGYGISKNIKDCYRFLFEHFQSGDQIFMIGFSRGAATVRSLSNFIHYFGILPRSRPELIHKAYRFYRIENEAKRKARADAFIAKNHTMWTRIKFIGCFDTVAALGIPIKGLNALVDRVPYFQHNFHSFKLSESVEHAYHALAIDDKRKIFHPVLWHPELKPYQTLHQVWFPGMHTDVGGGYRQSELSNISLVWMTRMAEAHGLRIYDKDRLSINRDSDGFIHDSRGAWWKKLYRKKRRSWPKNRSAEPVIHQSVLDRRRNVFNHDKPEYHPWILDLNYEVEPWHEWKNG